MVSPRVGVGATLKEFSHKLPTKILAHILLNIFLDRFGVRYIILL